MATKKCPYCDAENPVGVKYCETCGIPQVEDGEAPDLPPPPQKPKRPSGSVFERPAIRYGALGLAALLILGLTFQLGRASSGSSDTETFDDTAATETTAATVTEALVTTTSTTTITTTTTTTTIPIGFDDVGTNTEYADEINALTGLGVRVGCNPPANTLFCPNDPMTRGQMASLLVGALGYADEGSADLFSDDNGTAFESDIQKVAMAGITRGCNPPENDLFCPDDLVTRGQIAAFLVRAFDLRSTSNDDFFSDDNGTVYEPSIQKLATAGILTACNPPENTEVCPADNVTRGEMAALLLKALQIEE